MNPLQELGPPNAPAATDRLAPTRNATRPVARPRQRPDAQNFDGKCLEPQGKRRWGRHSKESDPRHLARLLRARRERPRNGRAAEERDERAALHSITSSASESRLSEILTPSAFAVLRLITISNLVGCRTGRSAGFAPLRIFAV